MLIVDKNTGDELTASEFNQIPDEIEKVITDSGQGPSAADVEQLSKGIYRLASEASWYTDSGVADAYVLTSAGGVTDLPGNFDGKLIRFIPDNDNTTTATVNVNLDGVTPLVDIAGVALVGGEILAGQETIATFLSSSGDYRLLTAASTTAIQVDNAIEDSDQVLDISDLFQLSKAFSNFSGSGSFYATTGAPNNDYSLVAISPRKEPTALLDGLEVRFKADFTNTGNTTITLPFPTPATFSLRRFDSSPTSTGEIRIGTLIVCYYNLASNFFVLGFNDNVPALTQQYSLKNLLINPRFIINQRDDASAAGVGIYYVDRWRTGANNAGVVAGGGDAPLFLFENATIEQEIENPGLASKTVTVSFIQLTEGSLNVLISGSATNSGIVALPSSGTTFTFGPSDTGNVTVEIINSAAGNTVFGGIQLEINNHRTDFDFRDTSIDFAMCLRYFETIGNLESATADPFFNAGHASSVSGSTGTSDFVIRYYPKRIVPTIVRGGALGDLIVEFTTSSPGFGTSAFINFIGVTAFRLRVGYEGISRTLGDGCNLRGSGQEVRFEIEAEL